MSRTNIEIDDDLMAAAMKASGQATKKGAVEQAMRQLVRNQELRRRWDGLLRR
jgi:Arc/MetJ family transcription regulator